MRTFRIAEPFVMIVCLLFRRVKEKGEVDAEPVSGDRLATVLEENPAETGSRQERALPL